MKLPSISKPSGAQVARASEGIYYFTVVAALVVGALAAHGLLGHSAFGTQAKHFMNATLPNHLPTTYWPAVGFGAAIAPMVLKSLVKSKKPTEKASYRSWEANKFSRENSTSRHQIFYKTRDYYSSDTESENGDHSWDP